MDYVTVMEYTALGASFFTAVGACAANFDMYKSRRRFLQGHQERMAMIDLECEEMEALTNRLDTLADALESRTKTKD